jgi:AbrB family looped-hinge helix DNA binding protein
VPRFTTLTQKGQVTIPKHVRDSLGLKPHDKVEIVVEGDEARLRKKGKTIAEVVGTLPQLDVPVEEMGRIAREERAIRRHSRSQ